MARWNEEKCLCIFDFDHTIVNGNTDLVIRNLVKEHIPEDIEEYPKTEGWTRYMKEVFRILHEKNFTQEQIRKKIREIPEVSGFINLFQRLHTANFDLVIISDSNSIFIEEWLKTHNLLNLFMKIYTNPARFLDSGLLKIQPFQHQTECKLSAENLCKGQVMERFISDREKKDLVHYKSVVYVGDGTNDICPVMRLGQDDVGCARKDYGMKRILERNSTKLVPKAKIIVWSDGHDLLEQLGAIFTEII